MAEKTLTVTYKKSRRPNKRAFKLWDTAYMYESMQEAINIRANIENLADERNEDISDLGHAAVHIEVLYKLVDAYIDGYGKLLNENLIKTANISKIQPTIN